MKIPGTGIGILEIVIILVVILIIFGPKNLPKLGTAIGKTVKNLREGLGGKKKKAEEAEAQAKTEEPEELEVVDKPEPGKRSAENDAKAQAEAEKDFSTSDAVTEETEKKEPTE